MDLKQCFHQISEGGKDKRWRDAENSGKDSVTSKKEVYQRAKQA
jgi:hypothetical protein